MRIRVPSGIGFDIGSLATTGVDHISVYRGPAAMIHGAGALTGAIELGVAPGQPRHTTSLSSSALVGSFQSQEVAASAQIPVKKRGSARAAFNLRKAQGDFPFIDAQGTPQRRTNNDHFHLQGIASGNWRGPRGVLGLSLLLEKGSSGVAGPSEFQNLFGAARHDEQRIVATSNGTRRDVLSGDTWTIDMSRTFGLQWRGLHYSNDQAVLGQGLYENSSSATSSEANVAFLLSTASHYYTHLSAGARTEIFDSSTSTSPSLSQAPARTPFDARRRTLSLATGHEKIFFDNRLHLTGAARAEIVTARREEQSDYLPWMAAAGFIYKPVPRQLDLQLIGNIAQTYRVPDFDELYLDTEFVRGDPDLSPERALMADLGVRMHTPDDIPRYLLPERLELVAFSNLIHDQIAFVPASAYLILARNFDRVRARGLEASLDYEPLSSIRLTSSYSFTQTYRPDLIPRVQLPSQPVHRADARLFIELARLFSLQKTPALTLSSRASWRSAVNLDTFGSQRNPAWLRLDAGLNYRPLTWLSFQLDITNLLDYQRAVDSLQRPLPGRAVFGSVSIQKDVKNRHDGNHEDDNDIRPSTP